jgi:taurine dioxygenase
LAAIRMGAPEVRGEALGRARLDDSVIMARSRAPCGAPPDPEIRMSAAPESSFQTITVTPLSPTIGAEIGNVRMSGEVPDEQIGEIRQALLDWKVIFFRDQDVSIEEHIAFGARFGELEIHPFGRNRENHPEVLVIHHDERSKQGQNSWHSDVTWRQEPSLGSILRGYVIPEVGGDTLFADMFAAYEGLSDEVKERIEGRTARHDFLFAFGGRMSEEAKQEMLEKYPPAHHPVVRTHPESGHKGIYVNAAFTREIDDMDPDESRRLLRHLYRQASVPEYQCRFRWRKDSVAFWDNRAVQHYANFDYHPQTRHVERVTVVGDRPR